MTDTAHETNCLFCKIVNHSIKSDIVYEDDTYCVFKDINPQAPLHWLIIPKEHIDSLNELDSIEIAGGLLKLAAKLAKEQGYEKEGYRTVINCQAGAGQTVFHIHLHLLAGRSFHWPPG